MYADVYFNVKNKLRKTVTEITRQSFYKTNSPFRYRLCIDVFVKLKQLSAYTFPFDECLQIYISNYDIHFVFMKQIFSICFERQKCIHYVLVNRRHILSLKIICIFKWTRELVVRYIPCRFIYEWCRVYPILST